MPGLFSEECTLSKRERGMVSSAADPCGGHGGFDSALLVQPWGEN